MLGKISHMAIHSKWWNRKNPDTKTFTLSCVVDKHPRFYVELILWIISAKKHLPPRYKIIVYHFGLPADIVKYIEEKEIELRRIPETVLEGSPHCNKIYPFLENHHTDYSIVTDTDVFWVEDPSGFFVSDRLRACPNNHSVPSPDIFKTVLSTIGLGWDYRPTLALFPGGHGLRETLLNNISAGVVGLPSRCRKRFAHLWIKWARFLVENREILQESSGHIDQISFALACEEMGEDVEFLSPCTNVILHLIEEVSSVYAFHLSSGHIPQFPSRFNVDRTLRKEGLPDGCAHAVDRLNPCIDEAMNDISKLKSINDCVHKFLNPKYDRSKDIPLQV